MKKSIVTMCWVATLLHSPTGFAKIALAELRLTDGIVKPALECQGFDVANGYEFYHGINDLTLATEFAKGGKETPNELLRGMFDQKGTEKPRFHSKSSSLSQKVLARKCDVTSLFEILGLVAKEPTDLKAKSNLCKIIPLKAKPEFCAAENKTGFKTNSCLNTTEKIALATAKLLFTEWADGNHSLVRNIWLSIFIEKGTLDDLRNFITIQMPRECMEETAMPLLVKAFVTRDNSFSMTAPSGRLGRHWYEDQKIKRSGAPRPIKYRGFTGTSQSVKNRENFADCFETGIFSLIQVFYANNTGNIDFERLKDESPLLYSFFSKHSAVVNQDEYDAGVREEWNELMTETVAAHGAVQTNVNKTGEHPPKFEIQANAHNFVQAFKILFPKLKDVPAILTASEQFKALKANKELAKKELSIDIILKYLNEHGVNKYKLEIENFGTFYDPAFSSNHLDFKLRPEAGGNMYYEIKFDESGPVLNFDWTQRMGHAEFIQRGVD